jgi:UDP:flavonoid glycosyltransferase YjiC (YdhE family)
MARFLLCTIPIAGHVSPGKALACALIQRGHEVWWYTGGAFKPLVESTGAKFVLIQSWSDYSDPDNVPKAVTDQRQALRGPAQLKFDLKHFFIDVAAGQVKDIAQILETFRADVW